MSEYTDRRRFGRYVWFVGSLESYDPPHFHAEGDFREREWTRGRGGVHYQRQWLTRCGRDIQVNGRDVVNGDAVSGSQWLRVVGVRMHIAHARKFATPCACCFDDVAAR